MYSKINSLPSTALRSAAFIIATCLAAASAQAITVKVKVENVSKSDGLWFTPVFFGFHDGTFNTFDPGYAATTSLENLAEEGQPGGLISDLSGVAGSKAHVLFQDGSGMPPGVLFAPGESNEFTIDLDALLNRYLSFASMILPSNDSFLGNADPTQYQLFDDMGKFNGNLDINLFGSNIWDAGTEENDFKDAPFSPLGMSSTDTIGGSVSLLGQTGLDNFAGRQIATGAYLSNTLYEQDQIARISIQQVPDTTQYIGFMSAFALIGFHFVSRKRMGKIKA